MSNLGPQQAGSSHSGVGTVVVLAAGMGKRMLSHRPKVLHEACGRPLLASRMRW